MNTEKITFKTDDGMELVGILETPEKETKTPSIDLRTRCIVLCHGITSDKDEDGIFIELSEKLVAKGYAVFRFDFRGHGESGGRSIDMTITGEQKDLEAGFELLEKRGYTDFGLLGASFAGGAVILYLVEHIDKIKALVLWNANIDYYSNFHPTTLVNKKYWGQKVIDSARRLEYAKVDNGFIVGKKLIDEMLVLEPWKLLIELETPTLLVHGKKDEDVDYHESVKYSLLMKNAQLEIIKDAGHGMHDTAEHGEQVDHTTVDFFVKHL